jgi:hypothetical protein
MYTHVDDILRKLHGVLMPKTDQSFVGLRCQIGFKNSAFQCGVLYEPYSFVRYS